MKTVLFLCTGNYYRSRFAEIVFNELAQKRTIGWRAMSRGISAEISRLRNPGPISQVTLTGLAVLNIACPQPVRYPQKATYDELNTADRVIALSEKEHRTMLRANYPEFDKDVAFWEIGDVGVENTSSALQRLEEKVIHLVENLNNER